MLINVVGPILFWTLVALLLGAVVLSAPGIQDRRLIRAKYVCLRGILVLLVLSGGLLIATAPPTLYWESRAMGVGCWVLAYLWWGTITRAERNRD